MNVPPVLPVNTTEPPAPPGAVADAGGDEFAKMIASTGNDGGDAAHAERPAGDDSAAPSETATANVAGAAVQPEQPPGGDIQAIAIQSLITDVKPQSDGPSSAGRAVGLLSDIEAMLAAPTPSASGAAPTSAAGAETEQPGSAAPEQMVAVSSMVAAPSAAKAAPADKTAMATKPAKPEPAALPRSNQVALDSVLAEFANPPATQIQSVSEVAPHATKGAPTEAAATAEETLPAAPIASAYSAPIDNVPLAAPLAEPVAPPSSGLALAANDIDLDALATEPSKAASASDGAGKGDGGSSSKANATGGNPATNAAAPVTDPSGLVRSLAAATNAAAPDSVVDPTGQSNDGRVDGAADKPVPPPSATGANSAHAQPAVNHNTAAAFGSDLRLGADGTRPPTMDHVFRGHTLQPAAEQVAVQITRAVQQSADRITVNLKPASLGSISVDLEIGPDHRLIAVISADRPETLDLMQRDARGLERALNDAGIKTDSGSLSFNLRGEGDRNGTYGQTDGGAADWSSFAAPGNASEAPPMPVYARTLAAGGGIDIRV